MMKMIEGIGVDIVEVSRFEKVRDKRAFLEQVLTNEEIQNGKRMHDKNKYWARLFVIKETLSKAFKIGLQHGSYWRHISINRDFVVTLSGYFKKIYDRKMKVFVAHSCSKKYAVSIALIHN